MALLWPMLLAGSPTSMLPAEYSSHLLLLSGNPILAQYVLLVSSPILVRFASLFGSLAERSTVVLPAGCTPNLVLPNKSLVLVPLVGGYMAVARVRTMVLPTVRRTTVLPTARRTMVPPDRRMGVSPDRILPFVEPVGESTLAVLQQASSLMAQKGMKYGWEEGDRGADWEHCHIRHMSPCQSSHS